jgi:iron complex outermembrane receptor protein
MRKMKCNSASAVGLVMLWAGFSPSAFAQAAQTAEEPEPIVVTARKREELAQDVPVAVSAFSAERLADENIRSVDSLVERVPGVNIAVVGSSFSNQISIRGQGQGRAINAEVATGLYRNGAYIAGGNLGGGTFSRLDFFDAERVEVYRGPQGASFGRNAIGGAINVVSARPKFELSNSFRVSYGTNSRVEVDNVLNLPISDSVALRIGGLYHNQDGGFFLNTRTGRKDDQERAWGLRGSLGISPSVATDIFLTADYLRESGPAISVGAYNPSIPNVDPYLSADNSTAIFDRREQLLVGELRQDVGFATLASITAYKARKASSLDDLDGFLGITTSTLTDFIRVGEEDFKRWSQELRLASNGDGPFSWVVGGEVLGVDNDSSTNATGARPPAAFQNSLSLTETRDRSYALFGLIAYEFSDKFDVSGELRYSRDRKNFFLDFTSFSTTGLPTRSTQEYQRDFEKLSPVFAVSFKPIENISLYARYGSGFRAGGFNNVPDPQAPARFEIPYEQENAKAYEIGTKTAFFDGKLRFDLAGYIVKTDDLLVTNRVFVGNRPINYLQNAAEAELKGVEAEIALVLPFGSAGGRFNSYLSVSYTDGEITAGALAGSAIPFVRDWQVSLNSTLRQPINPSLAIFVTHSYRGAWGGFEDQPSGRNLDDVELHDFRAGLKAENWEIALALRNAFDEFYNPQKQSATSVRASIPQTWSAELRLNF